ncbi:MAG: glycosyltransferase family 2 protein [Thermomicrobiales bacterium]
MREILSAAVIVPALNEEGNIAALVAEVREAATTLIGVEIRTICVVDNGSTDGTGAVAASAGAKVVVEPVRGYGRACLSGAIANDDVDLLIFMDGDRSEVPAEMAEMMAPLLRGEADLVVGSRVRGRIEPGALSPAQRWGNRFAGWFMFVFYRVRITDLGPFRAIRRSDLLALDMQEMTYGWPTEMIARSVRAGLRFEEIPVTCRRRTAGVSKVSGNLKASALTGWRIFNVILGVRRATLPKLGRH